MEIHITERRYETGKFAAQIGIAAHCIYLIFFITIHAYALIWVNLLFSFPVYIIAYIVSAKRTRLFTPALVLAGIQIVIHSTIATLLLGVNSAYHLLYFCFPLTSYLYKRWKIAITVTMAITLVMSILINSINLQGFVIYKLSHDTYDVLKMINGMTLVFILYSFFVLFHNLIDRTAIKLEIAYNELESKNIEIIEQSEMLKSTNAELKKTKNELIEANTAKDRFISIMAHDIKNLVHSILLTSDSLHLYWHKYEETDKREDIHQINQTTKNLGRLLENLLLWARSQGNKLLQYHPERFDLFKLIEENLHIYDSDAKVKNITVRSMLMPDTFVDADRNMVVTILRNLIANSVKFTKQNGLISIYSNTNTKYLKVTVEDNGVGMGFERQETLFHLDSLKPGVGTDNERGTGLGLLVCKEFVEKHGGRLDVDSEVGVGTKISFTIPLANN